MGDIKAGVVVVTKFCRANSKKFQKYIEYIYRDEAVRQEHNEQFNLYADYMGNPEKTTGLFTDQRDSLSETQKRELKAGMQAAQENGSLMWQTVISFDNRWLDENGIYDSQSRTLDEKKMKEIVRSAVGKMLKNENLENALWSASIHYNTDNIHIHVATVEPQPMRQKKEYIQYRVTEESGRCRKEPILTAAGEPIKKEEYVGRFKGKSIQKCKSSIVNQILEEQDANIVINRIIRGNILAHKKEKSLLKDRMFRNSFLKLYSKMPDVDRKLWNYNSNAMTAVRGEIDELTTMYLKQYHDKDFEDLKKNLKMQELQYSKAYGDSKAGNHFTDRKMEDLYARMGNLVLKELRNYDKEIRYAKIPESTESHFSERRERGRAGWLLASSLSNLKKSFKKEWEKEQNDREHERLAAGNDEVDY